MIAPYDLFLAPFIEFPFMRRSLVGCLALAVGGAPVGVFLLLRRMSLTGDALSHAILPGVAVGYLVAGLTLWPMALGGLAAGVIVAMSAGALARTTALKEDGALASFYLVALALGVTLVSIRGSSVDLLHVLFGSPLGVGPHELVLLVGIATVTLVVLALVLRPLTLDSADPVFLRSVSQTGAPVHLVFIGLVVLNLVGGFVALGTLLAVGLIMLPAAASRFWSVSITGMLGTAMVMAAVSALGGLLMSYHADLPTGPSIVLLAGGVLLFSVLFGRHGGFLARLLPRRHLSG